MADIKILKGSPEAKAKEEEPKEPKEEKVKKAKAEKKK